MVDGVEYPIDPRTAFSNEGEFGLDSRVAFLLVLGAMYGSGREPILESLKAFRDDFPLPNFEQGNRLQTADTVRRFETQYDFEPTNIRSLLTPESSERTARRRNRMAELVGGLYERRRAKPETVGDILLFGLGHPNEFVRAAAAISFLDLFDEVSLAVRALLSVLAESADELAGQIAEIALRRFGVVSTGSLLPAPPSAAKSASTLDSSILIHGSHFAFVGGKIGTWWQPGGDFHSYIRSNFRPNLYSRPDCFVWSGGWSDHARRLAAIDLRDWARNRRLSNFDVIAHSHGGSVAMWATQLGVELNNLILLSCPVHLANYQPEFARVKRVVSYQIKMDWVILADGGGTYFNHPQIEDVVLPKWFRRHDDTHDPSVWQKNELSI